MKLNKELYSILYLRELDFRNLSYYKSRKYGIERKIYKYVGMSDETLRTRTSKWTRKNIDKDNKIGRLLRSIMAMERLDTNKELNNYMMKNTKILRSYRNREQAEKMESTLISINLWEQENLGTICLNSRDAEVRVVNGKYVLNS